MAEFQKALEVKPDQFVAERIGKLSHFAKEYAAKGDKYFLARQHAYFLSAYSDCKCAAHSCGGCTLTLAIAAGLEPYLTGLDPQRVDQEEAKASAIRSRLWQQTGRVIRRVSLWSSDKAGRPALPPSREEGADA